MKFALDTNVLVYFSGVNGAVKQQAIIDILDILPKVNGFVPVQAMGELFNVLIKKAGRSPREAQEEVLFWQKAYKAIPTSYDVMLTATDVVAKHQLAIWDAIILAAALAEDCDMLISEDMQNGFSCNGCVVVNPFASTLHPMLRAALDKSKRMLS